MARVRTKTRVEHLADSLVELNKASEALHRIDLRTTKGDLRLQIKTARERTQEAMELTAAALKADTPVRSPMSIAV